MIDQATFFGGSKHVTTAVAGSLHRGSPRVVVYEAASTGTQINLWQAGTNDAKGGPYYIIINRSGRTLQLWDATAGAAVGASIANNQSAFVHLLRNDAVAINAQWRVQVRASVPSTHFVGTRSLPSDFPDTDPKQYNDPACFTTCESFLDLDPSGIVAPMFFNSAAALNRYREPIRAADVHMPKQIGVAFDRSKFTIDPNHPNSASLSEEMWQALFGIDEVDPLFKFHVLTYQAAAHGNSRHWHHIRYNGAWDMPTGGVGVRRHFWRKLIPYTRRSDNRDFTIEIRLVVEHTCDPEPVPGPTPGSGQNDAVDGAWGSLFHIYVFCDEAAPSYTDGTNFTPAGWSAGIPFTMNDPAVWGGNYTVQGGDDASKVCHPHMLIAASIATTMEAPNGYQWHEGQYDRIRYCYRRSSGIPWTTPSTTVEIESNGVFGSPTPNYVPYACMTLGGDAPYSVPYDWVIVENPYDDKASKGMTFLMCSAPGWSESEGSLDLFGGSAVKLCLLPQEEDQNPISTCAGHPDEPLGGVGGTHRCFLDEANGCCIAIIEKSDDGGDAPASATLIVNDKCVRTTVKHGPEEFGMCVGGETKCEVVATITTSYGLSCEDYWYNYGDGSDNLGRYIWYTKWLDDPTVAKYSYTYLHTSVADFSTSTGSCSFAAPGWTITSASVGGTFSFALVYAPSGALHKDVIVKANVPLANGVQSGIGVRCFMSGSTMVSGYAALLDRQNDRVRIFKYVSGVETMIAERTSAGISALSTTLVTFRADGSTLNVSGGAFSLTVEDCEHTNNGNIAWLTKGTSGGLVFGAAGLQLVEDRTINPLVTRITYTLGSCVSVNLFPQVLRSYGKCTETSANILTCNGFAPDGCGCTVWFNQLYGGTPGTTGGCTEAFNRAPAGQIPGQLQRHCYEGEPCDPNTTRCPECPPPFVGMEATLPTCTNPLNGDTIVSNAAKPFCKGTSWWAWSSIACL